MSFLHMIECTVDPAAAPDEVGQHWVNTTNGCTWFSVGTSAVSDWLKLGDTNLSRIISASIDGSNVLTLTRDDTSTITVDLSQLDDTAAIAVVQAALDAHIADADIHIDWTAPGAGTIDPSNYVDNDTTDHTALSNIGTNTHAQIDAHIADVTTNPHNVTATQTGAYTTAQTDTAISNAIDAHETSLDNHDDVDTSGKSVGDKLCWDGSNWVADTVTNLFGSEFQEASSLGLSSTTSTTFQNKLTLVTPALPAGNYRIGWSYSWSYGSTGNDFEARVTLNAVDIMNHAQEPKDAGTDQLHRHTGFEYQAISGINTIELDYRTDSGGVTAWIQRARLEIWRVS